MSQAAPHVPADDGFARARRARWAVTAAFATNGALLGALAIEAVEVLERLTPGAPGALRSATADARWILVSEDGHEAEWLAWHLQARGVRGAVFVVGGYRRLRQVGINGTIRDDELAIIASHDS